jgi:hypothetical protein
LVKLAPIDSSAASDGLAANKNILRDVQVWKEAEFLVNGCDPRLTRFARIVEMHSFTIQKNLAMIRLMNAGNHFDKRGFSGTVLPQQRVHFATLQSKRNLVQYFYTRKTF